MNVRLLHYSDLENAFDYPERVGRLVGTIDALRDDATLVVGTGDNTGPGVLSLYTDGRHVEPFFDAVRPDADTFGNHDFDYGIERARELVRSTPQTWLSANVFDGDERFGADEGVVPWTLVDLAGTRVGLFGLSAPDTGSINGFASVLSFTDPVDAARKAVSTLRSQGAEYVVALSHCGYGDDAIAEAVDVDVILGGHAHSERREFVNGTLCTRTGAGGRVLLEVVLGADGPAVRRHPVEDGPLDESIAGILSDQMAATGLDEVVATVDDPIERTRATRCAGESRVGNFVADATRWAFDADVALQNAGSLRDGPPLAGPVTVADLVGIVPFEAEVVLAEVTGAELHSVFREGDPGSLGFSEPGTWHAHLSGASVQYDADRNEIRAAHVGGEPIELDATYTLATSAYILSTDNEFPTLERAHEIDRTDVQYEVVTDYAREVGIDPTLDGRIVIDGELG